MRDVNLNRAYIIEMNKANGLVVKLVDKGEYRKFL